VDPRTGLDDLEKRKIVSLPGHEPRHLGSPVRIALPTALSRLSFPSSMMYFTSAEVRIREQALTTSAVMKNCSKMVRHIFHPLPALTAGTQTHEVARRSPSPGRLSLSAQ
jgi:hypothetical protein